MDSPGLRHGLWGRHDEPPTPHPSPTPTPTFTLPEAPGLTFPTLGAAARYQAAWAHCQRLRVELAAAEDHLRELSYQAEWSLDAIWEQEG